MQVWNVPEGGLGILGCLDVGYLATLSPAVREASDSSEFIRRGAKQQREAGVGRLPLVSCSPTPGLCISGPNGTCELVFGQRCSVKSGYSGQALAIEMSTSHDLLQD